MTGPGADELTTIASAIADPHAAGAQPGRPDFGHIGPDDRVIRAAEERLHDEQDVKQGPASDVEVVEVALRLKGWEGARSW